MSREQALQIAIEVLYRKGYDDAARTLQLTDPLFPFVGDAQHPHEPDYVATNLADALEQVPRTGDWWWEVYSWCEQTRSSSLPVLRTQQPDTETRR